MGIKLQNSSINSSRRSSRILCEINVTPLVDVMLVLLIIFMITSPLLVAGITVDLPETKSEPIKGNDQPVTVTLDKEGLIYINDTQTQFLSLIPTLKSLTKEKFDTRIFVRGDKNISYGEIMKIVSEINSSGFNKVALITNIKDEK